MLGDNNIFIEDESETYFAAIGLAIHSMPRFSRITDESDSIYIKKPTIPKPFYVKIQPICVQTRANCQGEDSTDLSLDSNYQLLLARNTINEIISAFIEMK